MGFKEVFSFLQSGNSSPFLWIGLDITWMAVMRWEQCRFSIWCPGGVTIWVSSGKSENKMSRLIFNPETQTSRNLGGHSSLRRWSKPSWGMPSHAVSFRVNTNSSFSVSSQNKNQVIFPMLPSHQNLFLFFSFFLVLSWFSFQPNYQPFHFLPNFWLDFRM